MLPKKVYAKFNGTRRFRGDQNSDPSKKYFFTDVIDINDAEVQDFSWKEIKLLSKAPLVKGKRYEMEFNKLPPFEPIRIIFSNGEVYYKKNKNSIWHIDTAGNHTCLSDNPGTKKMGSGLRAYNQKQKKEGNGVIPAIKQKR